MRERIQRRADVGEGEWQAPPREGDAGAWLRPFGRLVYAMPPYISTDDDVAVITGAMRAVVEACG